MDKLAMDTLARELRKPFSMTQDFFLKPFKVENKSKENPNLAPFHSVPLMALPEGWKLENLKPFLDKFRDKPERRAGKIGLQTAQSLIDFANRNKGDDTVLFASAGTIEAKITAIFDFTPAGTDQEKEGWKGFEASYNFPTSEAFKAWAGKSGRRMQMKEFGEFLSDRAPELGLETETLKVKFDLGILSPTYATPGAVIELAEGISINAKRRYGQHQRLNSGEHKIEFSEEHGDTTNRSGKTVTVPQFFLIHIQVFEEGPYMLIPVRLKYSVDDENKIGWTFDVWNVVKIFETAFREEVGKINTATNLPQFFGSF